MRWESRPKDATRRTIAGARLAAISVLSGALATGISLLAVAYVASVGSAVTAERASSMALAREALPLRRGQVVASEPQGAANDGDDPTAAGSPRSHPIGSITLVDVPADVASLDDELERQGTEARSENERLLILVVVPDCKPCDAVEASLPSRELQAGLGRSRLVRLNAADFLAELSRIGVPVDAFPGFFLLGPDGHARDYLNGGEWDEDTPENIAPVLKSFAEGTSEQRKIPWRGGPHEDETPI